MLHIYLYSILRYTNICMVVGIFYKKPNISFIVTTFGVCLIYEKVRNSKMLLITKQKKTTNNKLIGVEFPVKYESRIT